MPLSPRRWGGAWLPHRPHARPLRPEEIDDLALESAPPEVRAWLAACEKHMGRRLKRNDVVPFDLPLPIPPAELCEDLGVYRRSDAGAIEFTREQRIPMRVDVFRKPQPPWAQENMGLQLETLWVVFWYRNCPDGRQNAPQPVL